MLKSILTIDQATCSGFCNWKPGSKPVLSRLDLGFCNGKNPKIFSFFEKYLKKNLRENEVDFVCFETPILMRRDKVEKLRRLYGFAVLIEKVCFNLKIPCFEVPIPTWRKVFLHNAKLSGEEAKSLCMIKCNEIGLEYQGHDECEAFGIMDFVATKKHIKKDWSEPGLLNLT